MRGSYAKVQRKSKKTIYQPQHDQSDAHILYRRIQPPSPRSCLSATGLTHPFLLEAKSISLELYLRGYTRHAPHSVSHLDAPEVEPRKVDVVHPVVSAERASLHFNKYLALHAPKLKEPKSEVDITLSSNKLSMNSDMTPGSHPCPRTMTRPLTPRRRQLHFQFSFNTNCSLFYCIVSLKIILRRARRRVLEAKSQRHYYKRILLERRVRHIMRYWKCIGLALNHCRKTTLAKAWKALEYHHWQSSAGPQHHWHRMQLCCAERWMKKCFYLWSRYTVVMRSLKDSDTCLPVVHTFHGPKYVEWEYLHSKLMRVFRKYDERTMSIRERRQRIIATSLQLWRQWAHRRKGKRVLREEGNKWHCITLCRRILGRWRLERIHHMIRRNFRLPFVAKCLRSWHQYCAKKRRTLSLYVNVARLHHRTWFNLFCKKFVHSAKMTQQGLSRLVESRNQPCAATFWVNICVFTTVGMRIHVALAKCFACLRLYARWRRGVRACGGSPTNVEQLHRSRSLGTFPQEKLWWLGPRTDYDDWDVDFVPLSPWSLLPVSSNSDLLKSPKSPQPIIRKKGIKSRALEPFRGNKLATLRRPKLSALVMHDDEHETLPFPLICRLSTNYDEVRAWWCRDQVLLLKMESRIRMARLLHITGGCADPSAQCIEIEVDAYNGQDEAPNVFLLQPYAPMVQHLVWMYKVTVRLDEERQFARLKEYFKSETELRILGEREKKSRTESSE